MTILSRHRVDSTRSQAFQEVISTGKIPTGYVDEYSMFCESSAPFAGGYYKSNLLTFDPKILKPISFNSTPLNIAIQQLASMQGVQSACSVSVPVSVSIAAGSISHALAVVLSATKGLRWYTKEGVLTVEANAFPEIAVDPTKLEYLTEKSVRYWGQDGFFPLGQSVNGFAVRSIHTIEAGPERKIVFYA